MTLDELKDILAGGERLQVEFKSDKRQISDREIYEEIVALANSDGGTVFLGVEDDGTVTGAKPRHGTSTDSRRLQSAVFNNTVPNINTRIFVVNHPDGQVICIEVDSYPEPCATSSGKALRRLVGPDGKPQSLPFYPRDQRSRRIDLGLLDFSAQALPQTALSDLDPLEFERLRQTIKRLRGDQSLLELSDEDLVKALRLVESRVDELVPNVAGLLMLGRESVLEDVLPTHQVHFQVIDKDGNVRVNDAFRGPLPKVVDEIGRRFEARNEEREVQVGMFRLPVPDYSPEGFREAVNNALMHRDYGQNQSAYIQWQPDHMLITNPGGFPEGITANNILTHEPKPRNPRLAEALKRIGLVEQTGRGVDKIFRGQLRYGRPAPDYGRSDSSGVRVILHGGVPSLQFATLVYEEAEAGRELSLDELLILNSLYIQRRIASAEAARLIQKGAPEARGVLERLHERGMVEARGERKGRVYHLAASLYRRFGAEDAYVRTRGFDEIQQRQMILNYLDSADTITRKKAAELCKITGPQAYRILHKMRIDQELELHGKRRGSYYTRK